MSFSYIDDGAFRSLSGVVGLRFTLFAAAALRAAVCQNYGVLELYMLDMHCLKEEVGMAKLE